MSKYIQQAVDAIIRPPRFEYDYKSLPLFLKADDSRVYVRHPLVIENKRNQHIIGSLFHTADSELKPGPCVIYLHGNASAQLEGQFLVPNFCPYDIYVFVYDAVGCGCSDGDYISLGYYEKQDIEEIMEFLNANFNLGPFALWGRSMGAATAVLAKSRLLQSIVVDSAYTSIPSLVEAIAKSIGVPRFVIPTALWYLRNKVENIAKFDFSQVSPLESAKTARIPAVFGHAVQDQFVPYQMGLRIFHNYRCNDKIFVSFEKGKHNSRRDADWIRTSVEFVMTRFGMEVYDIQISECRHLQSSKYHFTTFNRLLENKESGGKTPRNESEQSLEVEHHTESIKLIAGQSSEEASGMPDLQDSSSKEEAYTSHSDQIAENHTNSENALYDSENGEKEQNNSTTSNEQPSPQPEITTTG